jgi:predicted nucleic acid-binding protein
MEFIEKYFTVASVDEKIALQSAKVIREHELTLAAANIAATAMVNSHKLLTTDTKNFERVKGLELLQV